MSMKSKISLIMGIVVFLASIAIYAITCSAVFPSTILGLCFLLYSEVVAFGGVILIDFLAKKSSKLLLWSGMGVSLGIYLAAVFISSLIFMGTHTTTVQGFLVIQIVLLVVVLAICLMISNVSIGTKKRDGKTLEAGRMMQCTIDQLTLIKEQSDKKADVDKLIERLRFSDTSVTVDADVEISHAIDTMQTLVQSGETSKDDLSKAVQSIEFLIKKRNLQAHILKRGNV